MPGPAELALALLLALPEAGGADHASLPGALEGRPPRAEASPLQARVDAAPEGATVRVGPGTWRGDLVLDRRVRLVGEGRPRLEGWGTGSVVRVRAAGASLEGFDVDGREGGNLGRDSSGIHVAAPSVTVRDCRVERSLFGIYLREAPGARVEGCTIRGIPGRAPGEKGSGIHVWNTPGFRIEGNRVEDARDGLYIQSSSGGTIRGNDVRNVRYGIHYMYSDDNVFEENSFRDGAAGAALMYSRRIAFRRNRFLHNRGFASVGLLLKTCDDVVAEDNLIADNARGLFLEGSSRNVFRRNVVAGSDVAVVLYDSSTGNSFRGNVFAGNLSPLDLVGRRTDTVFEGNYWSDHGEPDLDGDGRADRPYRLSSVFDHLRGNLTAADLMAESPAAAALAAAEEALPILRPIPVLDPAPLVRPPRLPAVPSPGAREEEASLAGIGLSAGLVLLGASALRRRV